MNNEDLKQKIKLFLAAQEGAFKALEAVLVILEQDDPPEPQGGIKPGYLSPNFQKNEMTCHHCGKIGPYPENLAKLMAKLEALRKYIGNKPINISSGYRCPAWNADPQVGGALDSWHTKDGAADIWVTGMSVKDLAIAADAVGFGGIGTYLRDNGGWVHVDIGPVATWQG